jgi:RNA polymerase sigma-70 factor, ECF subfamily
MRVMGEVGTVPDAAGEPLLAAYDVALPEVYGYLLPRCGDRAVAEDLTAETFLAAVDAVRRPEPHSARHRGAAGAGPASIS